MKQHRQILHKLIQKYKSDIEVYGILVYGSMATETETENSDIDLWIYKSTGGFVHSIDTINGIKSLNPSLILLANNHILDHGEDGLKSTVDTLSKNNINYTGIINNNSDEMVAHYFEKENKKVGIYNLCENEFTVAGKNSRGANPYDGIKNYLEIKKN